MKSAVFLDLDGTLLRKESQFHFLLWCCFRGIVPRLDTLCLLFKYGIYLTGQSQNSAQLRDSGFALLKGVSVKQLEKAGIEFSKSHLAKDFRCQALALIKAHRQQGHVIVLVTSAGEPVALPVATQLEVDSVFATKLISHDGYYTGARLFPEPHGLGKRVLVEQFCVANKISAAQCFAYADHHGDIPLLEFVGFPIAANPTRKLRQIAEEKNWLIADLDNPDFSIEKFADLTQPCWRKLP